MRSESPEVPTGRSWSAMFGYDRSGIDYSEQGVAHTILRYGFAGLLVVSEPRRSGRTSATGRLRLDAWVTAAGNHRPWPGVDSGMPDPIHVLGFAGSLRIRSYNKAVLAAATKLAPASMTVTTFDLGPVPLFNSDVEKEGLPDAVQDLREQLSAADGLLIFTPEYNAGPAAVTKNAIDWLSRDPDPPLRDKPVALAGVAGRFGTARAQSHLRDILTSTRSLVLNRTLALTRADGMFDADLELVDESARSRIERHLAEFGRWIEMTSSR